MVNYSTSVVIINHAPAVILESIRPSTLIRLHCGAVAEIGFDELMAYVDSGNSSVLTQAAVDGVRGAVFVSHPEGTPR